jgi:ssDNA-binding Zn-finger/Zn-ribbon topoisomerase 1
LIGFVQRADKPLKNLAATVENEFCSIILTSLDGKPIAQASRLLLVATARAANTGMKWNDKRTSLTDWGTEPSLIEPVRGFVTLKGINPVERIEAMPLDSGAKPLSKPIPAEKTADGYRLPLGEPATPWYLIRITHISAAQEDTALDAIPETKQVWVKCDKCDQSYQMSMRQYYKGLEEKVKANPSPFPLALPLKCAKCGQDGIRKAFKCDQCGEVFFANSIPADFEDRCPKCGYSTVEATRKARSGSRTGP